MKNSNYLLLIPLLMFIVLLHSSCDKDEDEIPDYVGKWETEINVPVETGFQTVVFTLDLKTDAFIETFNASYYSLGRVYFKSVANEGTVSTQVNSINFYPTKIIKTSYYDNEMKNVDFSESYTNKDEDFISKLEGLTLEMINQKMEYNIVGNILTLKADKNNDGDYSDIFETIVYTRQ
jgi:hypothetical protein